MQKVDNVRASYNAAPTHTKSTNAPLGSLKNFFKKLIVVKNNAIAYLSHVKTQYAKSLKCMIFNLKLVRADKNRSAWTAGEEEDNIVLLTNSPLIDPTEKFEIALEQQCEKMNKNFHENIADGKYKEQIMDAIFSACYQDAKLSFEKYCFYNKTDASENNHSSMPNDYLKAIGQAAYDWGVSCNEKKGVYIPKGAGANPLLTSVISIVQKNHPNEMNKPLNVEKVKNKIYSMIDKYCIDNGMRGPLEFKSELSDITEQWKQK